MKITFILDGYAWLPVGGYRIVYEYANNLTDRGHNVSIVHPRKMRNVAEPEELKGKLLRNMGKIRNLILRPKHEWQYINSNVEMLYVPEPKARYVPDSDVVFATAWSTAEYVMEYPSNKGIKFYLIQHYEDWAPEYRLLRTWKASLHKIVIARWLYNKGLELGVPDHQMDYIPNGIDLNKFRLIDDIEKRPQQIAMLYSSLEWKGSSDGLKALKIVKHQFKDLNVVLFGTESKIPSLPDWIEYYHDPSQEILIKEIYNGSSIYLCPSWSEGWHLPPAEAMACGCALVSTDIEGISDYAINNSTALLSEVKNPDMLAKNILSLLRNNELRFKLAYAGNKKIKIFKWKNSIDKLENILLG